MPAWSIRMPEGGRFGFLTQAADLNPRSDIVSVTMRQMLEVGVHFGHHTRYWNRKMAPYIFGHRNKIQSINLERPLAMYQEALKFARQLAANRGTLLFVGTKRQGREILRAGGQRRPLPLLG